MATAGVTTAVVIDDHPAITAGVESWCAAAAPPIEVLGTGATPAVAWTDPGLLAEVVVFDLMLDGKIPALGDLRRLVDTGRRVVVYTMRDDRDTILTCLDMGVLAYLTK